MYVNVMDFDLSTFMYNRLCCIYIDSKLKAQALRPHDSYAVGPLLLFLL